jgi:CheY-like chemotaxis protein
VTTDQRYSKLKGRNILIVEDEVLVAMMMEDILLEQGCTPRVAGEQKEALACLDGGQFDAAILDVNLNGAASFPIAEALKSRGVPFVFSTGYDERVLREGFGEQPVIRKPFLPDKLLDVLCDLV